MRITLLGADLGASLATHAVGHVGDGHDLFVVFVVFVLVELRASDSPSSD